MRLANGAMAALLAVWSFVFAVRAMVAGTWTTWGDEAVASTSLTINQEMFGTFALLWLALPWWMRHRYGPKLWDDVATKTSYAVLGFIARGTVDGCHCRGDEAGLLGTAPARTWSFNAACPV